MPALSDELPLDSHEEVPLALEGLKHRITVGAPEFCPDGPEPTVDIGMNRHGAVELIPLFGDAKNRTLKDDRFWSCLRRKGSSSFLQDCPVVALQ